MDPTRPALPAPRPRVGLALAGGGAEGAIWEIGALCALDDALEGVDLGALDVYVGVSAGSVVAACLANGITPAEMCRSVLRPRREERLFLPESFFRPAYGEYARRGLALPGLLREALWDWISNPGERTVLDALGRLSRALPVGLFDNTPLREYLRYLFSFPGRSDDFRQLGRPLTVVAVDLDSGEAVRFGKPGLDEVPISQAVQASTALPGLYPPVRIGDRYYVDGVLLKTLHASVALEAGVELVLCVNPIVPVDTRHAVAAGVMRRGRLVHRGLPTVLSQTFRTLVHSRLAVGLASYGPRYPGADIVLLEPQRDDYRMFFTNVFRLSSRRAVCQHAYESTRRNLLDRSPEIEPLLARHGLRLRRDRLADPRRSLWRAIGWSAAPDEGLPVTTRLARALDALEDSLDARGHRAETSPGPPAR